MKCSKCWVENDDESGSCRSCGHKFHLNAHDAHSNRGGWDNYFSFRKLVTPDLIKIFYFIGAAAITLGSIVAIASLLLLDRAPVDYVRSIGFAVLAFTIGNLIWRMLCEGAILIFSVHELLVSIEERLGSESFRR